MNYLEAMAKGYLPPAKARYSREEINHAKLILLELDDKDLLRALNMNHLFYISADEDFWQRRSLKKGLRDKASNITWKKYYLSQFI